MVISRTTVRRVNASLRSAPCVRFVSLNYYYYLIFVLLNIVIFININCCNYCTYKLF